MKNTSCCGVIDTNDMSRAKSKSGRHGGDEQTIQKTYEELKAAKVEELEACQDYR